MELPRSKTQVDASHPSPACPCCSADDSQREEYLALEEGTPQGRSKNRSRIGQGRAAAAAAGRQRAVSPPAVAMAGRLRSALSSIFAGRGRKAQQEGKGSTCKGTTSDVISRLVSSDLFQESDRESIEHHLGRLPPSYACSGVTAGQVKEHMRLLQEAVTLRDGFAALQMEVRDEDEFSPEVTASDSSCTSSAGGFSSLSSDAATQLCAVDVSFACRAHICRPDLASAMKQAGFSVMSLTIFDVSPRGSLGHAVLKVYRDDFSQESLESVFSSVLELRPSKRWAGIAVQRISSELSRENLFLDRRCDSGNPSPADSPSRHGRMAPSLRGAGGHRRLKTSSAGDVENILQALGSGGKKSSRADLTKFILDPIKLEMGQLIAMGASGEVRRGVYDGKEVAVKILKRSLRGKDTQAVVAEFKREVLTLMACGECPYLLKFYGICMDVRSRLCIVTKYMRGGTLHSYLQKRGGQPLPLQELLQIASDVAAGMGFLHRNGITHRDLKSANVLLDGEGHAVVGDFGVAKLKGERAEMTKEVGTYRWMAPEAFGTSAWPVTHKSDVYSYGIVLWELVSLSLPFESYTPLQAAVAVTLNGLRPTIPEDCPPGLRVLLESCWEKNPEDRPDFCTILDCLRKMAAPEDHPRNSGDLNMKNHS